MPLGTPGYPSHAYDATGSYSLYSRSPVSNYDHNYFVSGLEEEDDSSQASDSHLDGSNAPSDSPSNHLSRECTPQDDQLSLYDASSAHQSPELSSEEITSENDEQDNPANTEDYEYYNHPRTTPMSIPNHIQYSRPPDSITGDIWSPNSPYTPGTNAFIHPLSNTPSPGMSAYVQEGMSISHPYPKSQLTPGMSYYHRSEATTGPDVYCAGASSSSALPPTPRIMCPICLDPAQEITSTLCGHIFCAFCIKSALSLREACPVCNRAISRWSTHPIYPVL
ncbi:hypothetical protein RSOLAG1IB_04129 [Rhizoctonia solani AG-1 IB]|uniref:RING-type domain-containing protein n=1 Tax=Thanatephorus cucumeris (strain AG1-IB / isolate 7/3/14) TaxID=1108050 RepID=A0A0B7FT60_THACB|nr:hypothetical protein RSOLAG1IB_04129 [Rhizoctonia solani AG-1 IB]